MIVLQAGTELVIRRHYGWALVLITPLALIMTQLVAPEPTERLLVDRAVLTALGVAVAVALITAHQLFQDTSRRMA